MARLGRPATLASALSFVNRKSSYRHTSCYKRARAVLCLIASSTRCRRGNRKRVRSLGIWSAGQAKSGPVFTF